MEDLTPDWEWEGISFLAMPLAFTEPLTIRVVPDIFAEHTDEQLDQMLAVMALTPQHTYQVLTKRPERMVAYMDWCERRKDTMGKPISYCRVDAVEALCISDAADGIPRPSFEIMRWPLPNVWLGVTVENQRAADERTDLLRQTPAAVRFLSCEPLLEKVRLNLDGLDWVIVGGESGPTARPCDIEWIRSIVRQCEDADVPCFVKQLGSKPKLLVNECYPPAMEWLDYGVTGKGNDMTEWPEDLQVRQMPTVA
jgi:protein gp37